ncbi:MAG TPA: cytidine deaminase [Microlunatus sp.]|nr:cytidine deaminase [Microlunatus sp.]
MNTQPASTDPGAELGNPEDVKIIKLARAARARTGAAEAACVRDTDGRTYAATNVALPHLTLSAAAVAVAMAVSSGATGLEAVALVGEAPLTEADRAVIADLGGAEITLLQADPSGALRG